MSTHHHSRQRQSQSHLAIYPTPPTSSSETELDSPLEEHDDEYDYPISPTDPMMDMAQTFASSPDLSGVAGVSRAPSNSSFFNCVFLDMPDKNLTRPLKVKKRPAPVGPSRIRRRSARSLPRSPISPMHSTYFHIPPSPSPRHGHLVRDNSTSSSAHRAITDSFFAIDSPGLSTALHSPLPTIHSEPSPTSASLTPLGLGRFAAYGETVHPGLSPPASPTTPFLSSPTPNGTTETPSPILLTPPPRRTGASKPIPALPITPTNAPSKAARLLGTNSPLPSALKVVPGHKSLGLSNILRSGPKRTEHFRPLPNSTLTDIQRFFGDVPKKPSSALGRGPVKTHGSRAKVTAASMALRVEDKALPSVRGVGHRDGEGRMWLDEEEEQEFAWLMSDLTDQMTPGQKAKVEQAAGLGRATGDGQTDESKCIVDVRSMGKQVKTSAAKEKKKDKGGRKVFESFLDLGLGDGSTAVEDPGQRSSSDDIRPRPHTNRSISNPVLISTSNLIPAAPPRPTRSNWDLPPLPHVRSISAPSKPTSATYSSPPISTTITATTTSKTPSPTRPKHRPPPLDLRHLPPVRNLPTIITSLSPSQLRPTSLLPPLPVLTPRSYAHAHTYSKSVDIPGLPRRPTPADIPSFPSPLSVSYDQYTDVRRGSERVVILPPSLRTGLPKTPFNHPRRAPIPGLTGISAGQGRKDDDHDGMFLSYESYKKPETQGKMWDEIALEELMEDQKVSVFDPPSPTVATSGLGARGWFRKKVGRL